MDRWLAGLKGTLNLWDAHRVKVYNKEFRAEHPEYFDPDGIMVFCGPQGSGKTLSMIQYAYRLSLAYPDMIICTNVELHDWPPRSSNSSMGGDEESFRGGKRFCRGAISD